MGKTRVGAFTYSHRSTHKPQPPGARAYVERSRKRFQCDLLGFWRRCQRPGCRQRHRCLGDPHDCFSRHHPAMPHDDAAWLHAAILSRTTGTGTAERALRAFGLSLPGHIKPGDGGPSPSQQTDDAVLAVDPAHDDDASRRAGSEPEIPSQSSPEILAELAKALGTLLTGKPEPERASPPPSPQADAEAPAVAPKSEIRAAVEAFNERARKGMDYNDIMARLRALGEPV